MLRDELVSYLDSYLRIGEIGDYGPQGLQVEGKAEVCKVVALVDSHQPCVEAALERGADLMLVHHGLFWGHEKCIAGSFGKLVRKNEGMHKVLTDLLIGDLFEEKYQELFAAVDKIAKTPEPLGYGMNVASGGKG